MSSFTHGQGDLVTHHLLDAFLPGCPAMSDGVPSREALREVT